MKILKLIALCAIIVMVTVGASNGAPASMLTTVPAEPGITNPTSGELVPTNSTPAVFLYFTWTDTVGDLTHPGSGTYDIEISTDATFLNTAAIVSSSDGNHNPALSCSRNQPDFSSAYPFQPSTTYYVAIQAYDTTCAHDFVTGGSGWAISSFQVSVAAPSLTYPTPNLALTNNLPEFQWSSVSGATGYELQVSTSTAFSSLYLDVDTPYTNNYYTPAADLPNDTNFFWRVATLSNAPYSPSGWSSTCGASACEFTTGNVSAPPIPINISNAGGKNNKITNDFTPGLRWNEIALPGGTTFTSYEAEVSTDSTFTVSNAVCFDVTSAQVSSLQYQVYQPNPQLPQTTAQFDTQSALANTGSVFYPGSECPTFYEGGIRKFYPNTQYYWRIRAITSGGTSDWSTVFGFATTYARPDISTFTPANGAHLSSDVVTFSWVDVIGQPSYYDIQFSLNSDFTNLIANGRTQDPFTEFNSDKYPSGTVMYWRIRANGPLGPGPWSATATVITH